MTSEEYCIESRETLYNILNALPGAVYAFNPGRNHDIPIFINAGTKIQFADEASHFLERLMQAVTEESDNVQ